MNTTIPEQLLQCDVCRKEFTFRGNTYTGRQGDVETTGIECPHCKARFVAYRTNSHIRKLQARVRKEQERFRSKIAAGVAPNKAERKLRQVRRQLDVLFKKFNDGVAK